MRKVRSAVCLLLFLGLVLLGCASTVQEPEPRFCGSDKNGGGYHLHRLRAKLFGETSQKLIIWG